MFASFNTGKGPSTLFVGALVGLCASGLVAQDVKSLEARMNEMQAKYESRIAALEGELARIKTATEDPRTIERTNAVEAAAATFDASGLRRSSRNGNAFNPAIGVTSDLILTTSGRDDSFESDNQFRLRSVEINFAGRIDPHVKYNLVLSADEEEIGIEDAYADWDKGLPSTFTLRAGRMPIDFGVAAPMHDHELSFVDKPYAIQEYLGGRAVTTGAALHHWFAVGDVPIRWSVGVGNRLDGDSHAIQGPAAGEHPHAHEEEGAEPFGKRGTENFVWTARVSASFDIGSDDTLRVGTSGIGAPSERAFFFTDPPTNSVVDTAASDRWVWGVDLFWERKNPSREGGDLLVGGEWIWAREEIVDDSLAPPTFTGVHARGDGGYVMAQYGIDARWSIGARFDTFSHLDDASLSTDAVSLAVTWNVNEFNRVRLEGGLIDDELAAESYGYLMLQWTLVLGSHEHGIAW